MTHFLPFFLMPFILAATVLLYVSAAGAQGELEEKAPDYAGLLYRSAARQALFRALPIRVSVLFFQPVPLAAKGAVRALRFVFLLHLALMVSFVLAVSFHPFS